MVFLSWLERKRRAAAKECGAEDLRSPPAKANVTQVARPQCGKFSGAHKTASCSLPGLLEVMNVEDDVDGEPIDNGEVEMVMASVAAAQDGQPVQKSPKYIECEQRAGSCPDCKVPHTYQRVVKNGVRVQWPSEGFRSCPLYRAMTPED